MSSVTADPFGTARLRAAVLDSWRSSPTRFREDANVEEDYALGAYHDRLVIELAQNASDAARAAEVTGRLLLRLDDNCLTAANVGAPLDRAGVESLAAMRASSKSEGSVGRFGVGFAAVLGVSDAPEVRSRAGGVRFDRSATAQLLRDDTTLSALAQERVPPALRVPFPVNTAPPDGFDTAVVLPWRDETARQLGLAAVQAIDEVLLLSLPDLGEVIVEIASNGSVERHTWAVDRTTSPCEVRHDDQTSWWTSTSVHGRLAEQLEGTLPHEEAQRHQWSATVALPVTEHGLPLPLPASLPRVVHAPTPTDEPWGLPVVAIADFRLDPSRRHIAEGARTDAVVDALASAYVTLVTNVARENGAAALTLVPPAALVGPIDHRVRDAVRQRLTSYRWVPRARDGELAEPSGLVALEPSDPALVRVLAEYVADLADPDWVGDALRSLGLATRPLHEVWDTLAPLAITPAQWKAIYAEVQRLDAGSLEGLPVPLTDGRVLRGARTTMLAGDHGDDLALLGIDVVHTDAEHPLLERLGARQLEVRAVLDGALVRRVEDAVEFDAAEARQMVVAAASLLTDSGVAPGELMALASLPVPTGDGGWTAASSAVLPGSALDAVAAADAPRLAADLVTLAPSASWASLGVLAKFTPATLREVPLDPDVWDDVMVDGADWCVATADRASTNDPGELLAAEVTIVRGLELVDGVPLAGLAELLADPDVRRAIVEPTRVLTVDGRRVAVPSPAAWWLSETPLLEGRSPVEVRVPGDDRIAPFFPVVAPPDGIDLDLLTAIGVHTTLERWLQSPDGANELLDALADTNIDSDIETELLSALYAELASTATAELVDPPTQLRAVIDAAGAAPSVTAVTGADEVVVAIAPHHALVLRTPHIPGTSALAEVLDLGVSGDAACAASSIVGTGVERPVPQMVVLEAPPSTYREHDELVVGEVVIDWWVTDGGEVHAATLDGLARALAWVTGQWSRRFEVAAWLERPESSVAFTTESLYDR